MLVIQLPQTVLPRDIMCRMAVVWRDLEIPKATFNMLSRIDASKSTNVHVRLVTLHKSLNEQSNDASFTIHFATLQGSRKPVMLLNPTRQQNNLRNYIVTLLTHINMFYKSCHLADYFCLAKDIKSYV